MTRGRPKSRAAGKPSAQLKTVDRKPIRPLERQRMRPWLMDLLDKKDCTQLIWINKARKLFRVNWKHAAGQTFDPSADATLFERWARHTGKYYTGDKPDPKRWKANFRCALNSLLDVEEDKAQGVRKGNNAFKVYRFLDEKKMKKQPSSSASTDKLKTDDAADDSDEEFMVLKNLRGTRSRPKPCPTAELDSEGSEVGSSPFHDSTHSEWDMLTSDVRQSTDEQESQADRSPLPNFDQLCQTACPGFQEALSRVQGEQPGVSLALSRVQGEQSGVSLALSRVQGEQSGVSYTLEHESSDSSCSSDVLTDTEILENVEYVTENASQFPAMFWNTVEEYDSGIQEAPEEVVQMESNGPNVIVIPQANSAEYVRYTSIEFL